MASWVTPSTGNETIDTILNPVIAPTEAFQAAMETAADALDTASAVLVAAEAISAPDPVATTINVAVAELRQTALDLLNSDVYALALMPRSWAALERPYTIEDALIDLAASVADLRDPNRPHQLTDNAAFASLTILVGADNWFDFTNLLKTVGELWDGTELNRWARLFDVWVKYDTFQPLPREQRPGQGAPPDWSRTNWAEHVPPVGRALDAVLGFADDVAGVATGLSAAIGNVVDILRKRADYARAILQELSDLADVIARWQELVPKTRCLFVTGEAGGTAAYVEAVTNAGHRPDFQLCAGITLLVGGANPANAIKTVMDLIGLRISQLDEVAAAAET